MKGHRLLTPDEAYEQVYASSLAEGAYEELARANADFARFMVMDGAPVYSNEPCNEGEDF